MKKDKSLKEMYKIPRELEIDMLQAIDLLCNNADSETEEQINKTIKHIVNEKTEQVCKQSHIRICTNKLKTYDESTYMHSVRVSIICIAIGRLLNYKKDALAELGIAGLLHDIGKKFVPIEIITKTDSLDNIEMDIIKAHPAMSAYYLKQKYNYINEDILLGVYQHHERLDGSGYPRGLQGDEISEPGRIIAIADIFEAYSSKRSYHQQRTVAETVEFIRKVNGLDKEILELFLKHLDLESETIYFD